MSIHIMNAVWQHGPQDRNACFLLQAIADNANERGEAFPSLAVLGQKARMSKSLVIRTLQRLEAEGWLTVRKREAAPESYGRARGNLYVVGLAKLRLSSYGSRGVSATPRQKVASASAVDCATSDDENPRGVSLTPRQECVPDEVSNGADEVSKTAPRGVKTGVALIVEPSEPPIEPAPMAPQRGANDLDDKLKLQAGIGNLRQRLQSVKSGSADYYKLGLELIAAERELRRLEGDTGHDPPAEIPLSFPNGRRRRRLTEVQMMARVGGR